MKRRLAYWLARGMYPAAWRARYGDEFDALVEDSRPGWRGMADIAQAGLALQFQTPLTPARVALLVALAALALAIPGSFLIRDQFVSMASLKAPGGVGTLVRVQQEALRRDILGDMIERHKLYPNSRLPLEDRIEAFQRNTRITGLTRLGGGAQAFRVGFVHDDAAKAQAVTRELTVVLIDTYRRLNNAGPGLEVLDMASLPQQPISPNRPVLVAACLLIATALGTLLAMIRFGGVLAMFRSAAIGAAAGAVVVIGIVAASGWFAMPTAVAAIEMRGDAAEGDLQAAFAASLNAVMSDESLTAITDRHHAGPLAGFRRNLRVTGLRDEPGGHRVARLFFQHEDAAIARATLRDVMTSLIDHGLRQRPDQRIVLEVLQLPAVSPRTTIPRETPPPLPFGALLGALLGTIAAAWRWKPTPQVQLS